MATYEDAVGVARGRDGVESRGRGQATAGANQARGALFVTDAATFERDPRLAREVFGPASLLVRVERPESLLRLVDAPRRPAHGRRSTCAKRTTALAARLLPALERKAGRIIVNGWPTGVEVAHAMVHGGPFPATSDSRTTSVGSLAIERFLRPVCYQDVPAALLPDALRDDDAGSSD